VNIWSGEEREQANRSEKQRQPSMPDSFAARHPKIAASASIRLF
jgi:hypothetical protein